MWRTTKQQGLPGTAGVDKVRRQAPLPAEASSMQGVRSDPHRAGKIVEGFSVKVKIIIA